jgi:hypothetical protein
MAAGGKAAFCSIKMLQQIVCNEKGLPGWEALSALITALWRFC